MAKHHRKHKASGGETGEKDFGAPRDDWKAEESSKPEAYAGKGSNVQKESEEKKHGGSAKRKRRRSGGVAAKAHGGAAHTKIHKHHESGEHMKHAKHLGHVSGDQYHAPASHTRRERKAGGRTGSNFSPLSSAHAGTPPRDHKVHEID